MNFSTLGKYLLQTFSLFCLFSTLVMASTTQPVAIPSNVIKNVEYSTLPGNRLQISLELSELAITPLSFTIDNPAGDLVPTGA